MPEARKLYTDADYKIRNDVLNYVGQSRMVTLFAINEFADQKLGSSAFAKKTLADLANKANTIGLNSAQIQLGRNILRQHANILVQMFGTEVEKKQKREKARAENAANTMAAAPENGEEPPPHTDSDLPF